MADDIKIIVGVEDDDVLKTIKNHQILEKRIEELTKEYAKLDKLQNKGKLSAQDYAKAVQQLDRQINTLNGALKKGGTAVDQLATGMNLSGKAARRNEIAFQQAGYQVQDFIVQVQGGTNPLIAFSQQASQLAGFFAGPWGAMIGLGIAAASSLAMAFLATGEDAENLGKNLDDLESKLKDFDSAVKASEEKVSSFAYAMASVSDLQIAEAWSSLGESAAGSFEASFMAKIGAFLGANLWTGFETWSEVSGRLAGDSFANAFGEAAKGIVDSTLLEEIGRQIEAKNVEYLDATIEGLSAFTEMTPAGARFLEYLINARDAANGFTAEVKDAATELSSALEAGGAISKLNMSLGIEEAKKVAELLAENMNLSLKDALGIVNLARGAVAGGRGRDPREFTYLDEFRAQIRSDTPKDKKGKTGATAKINPLDALRSQLKLETELLGKTEEYVRVRRSLGDTYDNVEPKVISRLEQQIVLINEAKQAEEERKSLMQTVESSLESGFMSMIDGTKSVKDAFKDMARQIIAELMRVLVVKRAVSAVTGFFGFADGGVFQGGSQVKAFADGGVVGGPTTFPMAGGQTGLMGEAGPEAIMPLKRGANGKLGVQVEGGTQGNVVVNQSFNFSANGDESVKKLIAQAAPQIANMTQKQILDSRRRGGAMKSTFG